MMTLTTPALLFPAISLLLLAYTNRFLTVAQLIRQLHQRCDAGQCDLRVAAQLRSLRKRINLIKGMQMCGTSGFLLCTISMFALFVKQELTGEILFGISLVSLVTSLVLSLCELSISTHALNVELEDLERK